MKLNSKKSIILCLFWLSGCDFEEEISNKKLHDKVLACAAGFSDNAQARLHVASQALNLKGDISTEFKRSS